MQNPKSIQNEESADSIWQPYNSQHQWIWEIKGGHHWSGFAWRSDWWQATFKSWIWSSLGRNAIIYWQPAEQNERSVEYQSVWCFLFGKWGWILVLLERIKIAHWKRRQSQLWFSWAKHLLSADDPAKYHNGVAELEPNITKLQNRDRQHPMARGIGPWQHHPILIANDRWRPKKG